MSNKSGLTIMDECLTAINNPKLTESKIKFILDKKYKEIKGE